MIGSAKSSALLQSPSLKSAPPKPSTILHTPPIPSPLATDLSAKLNLPSLSPFSLNTTVQQGTPVHVHSAETSRSLEGPNLINFSLSPLQDPKLDLHQKGEESILNVSATSNKSSPPSQWLPQNDASSDLEQSIKTPPTTSQHNSLDRSHSIVEEKGLGLGGEDGGGEDGDADNASGQIAEESPPPKSTTRHSLTTSYGSTTPEPSPISQQPTSEELGSSQHAYIDTPSTSANSSHTTPSLQSSSSVASSSRKVAFRVKEGVSPSFASAQPQHGLFSPGSLRQQQQLQAGLSSFQTPPASSSSYQLMSELPPTPFQEANFDLDTSSSSESEHEGEERDHHQQLSYEGGDSFDSSYFSRLQKKVVPLISQEDIEASSLDHELDGVISRADMEKEEEEEEGEGPQPKLVDIDQSPSSYPTHLQPLVSHHHLHGGVLDSANSLKVDDLLGLDSPATSNHNMVLQQSPLVKAYQSPQVGLLVDIRTPGSNLSGKPLLTSTVQGHPVSATASREQRGHVPSPTSDILLPYLPSHSGTQSASGALLTSASVDSQRTWSSLMTTSESSLYTCAI